MADVSLEADVRRAWSEFATTAGQPTPAPEAPEAGGGGGGAGDAPDAPEAAGAAGAGGGGGGAAGKEIVPRLDVLVCNAGPCLGLGS